MNYPGMWGSSSEGVRNYIIVVAGDCEVRCVVESPFEGTLDDNNLYAALEAKWHELSSTYTWPSFDILSARGGDLQQIRNALPGCSGWETANREPLIKAFT